MYCMVILSVDCATTISIQQRPACPLPESSVSYIGPMAVPGGSVSRQYLRLYLGVFGFKIPIIPSGSILKYLGHLYQLLVTLFYPN